MGSGLKEPKTRGNPGKQAKRAQNTGQDQDSAKKGGPRPFWDQSSNMRIGPRGYHQKRDVRFGFIL